MAFLKYNGVGITALAAAIPRQVIDNYKYTQYFSEDQVKQIVDKVGIYERRYADAKTCSSDLCFAAAEKLIADNNIDKNAKSICSFLFRRLAIIACQLLLYFYKTVLGFLLLP